MAESEHRVNVELNAFLKYIKAQHGLLTEPAFKSMLENKTAALVGRIKMMKIPEEAVLEAADLLKNQDVLGQASVSSLLEVINTVSERNTVLQTQNSDKRDLQEIRGFKAYYTESDIPHMADSSRSSIAKVHSTVDRMASVILIPAKML